VIDPLILIRATHLAATALAAGTVAFLALVADPAGAPPGYAALRRRLNWTIWIALAVAILSGLAWLLWLSSDIYGAPVIEVCLHGDVWTVIAETRFGLVWSIRLILAVLLGALMLWPAERGLQLGAAAGLLILVALIGHAGATPGTAGTVHLASDMMHLIAAGGWLGALPALALMLAQARRGDERWRSFTVEATRRFSVLGIACVSVLLASGLVNSWNLVGSPHELVATGYGRLVLLKMGLFAAMLGIAATNRFRLTPQLPAPGALKALQRNSLAETALGLCVLLFVGLLGTLSPSNHAHGIDAQVPPGAAFVHIHTNIAMAEVTIEPGRAGNANAHIRVLRDNFSEYPTGFVELTLMPPVPGGTITRTAAHLPDGTWEVNALDLPQSGIWTVQVKIRGDDKKLIVLDAPIVIDPQ